MKSCMRSLRCCDVVVFIFHTEEHNEPSFIVILFTHATIIVICVRPRMYVCVRVCGTVFSFINKWALGLICS